MPHHRSMFICVTGSFFLSLVGYAGDAIKSSSAPVSATQLAQAGEGKDQSASEEVQERAVPRVGPGVTGPAGTLKPGGALSQPVNPGLTAPVHPSTPQRAPSPPTLMTPNPITAIQPLSGPLPLPNYPAPTPDLAAIARSIVYEQHSLSIIVVAQNGFILEKPPITISIGYFPSGAAGYGQYCQQRVTQTYAPSTGNTFRCALPEGDGQPRRVHLDITLSQPNPAGGVYNYNVPLDLTLHPRYDVTISPLSFQLITGCSTIGANQIDLNWFAPDQTTKQTVHFAAKDGERFVIREFSWARSAVSASANLHPVVVWYEETGFHPHFSGARLDSVPIGAGNLVPGKTYTSSPGLVRSLGGTHDCQATLRYTVTYTFRQYLTF